MDKIIRGSGFTASERYLSRLCDSTFLKLWTYPNTFNDRNKKSAGIGKEIYDLLVVCGDDVIIFSDKAIEWPDGSSIEVRWSRWYRRAVKKSVDQIRGAEWWLRDFPDRVFLDPECTRRLPIDMPPLERRRVHGIAIVRGASDACSRHFHGDEGSLLLIPRLKGDAHANVGSPGWGPFALGDVDPAGSFVHVFDEMALDCIMREQDTVTDFTDYLSARADAIRNEDLTLCASESDLLAYYMKTERPEDRPCFIRMLAEASGQRQQVMIWPGAYEDLVASDAYARKKRADAESYIWDRVIGEFVKHVMEGSSVPPRGDKPLASREEPALRIMARENRLRRRLLGAGLAGTLREAARRSEQRFARVAIPGDDGSEGEVGYVFMTLAYPDFELEGGYTRYRQVRSVMLETYCYAVLSENRLLKQVVGIAMDTPGRSRGGSEDLLALKVSDWTPELEQQLAERRIRYGILNPETMARREETAWEYPPRPPVSRQQRRAAERRAKKNATRQPKVK